MATCFTNAAGFPGHCPENKRGRTNQETVSIGSATVFRRVHHVVLVGSVEYRLVLADRVVLRNSGGFRQQIGGEVFITGLLFSYQHL